MKNPRMIFINNMWGRPKETPDNNDTAYIRKDAMKDLVIGSNYVVLPYKNIDFQGEWIEVTFLSGEILSLLDVCVGSVGKNSISIIDWVVNDIIEKIADKKKFEEEK